MLKSLMLKIFKLYYILNKNIKYIIKLIFRSPLPPLVTAQSKLPEKSYLKKFYLSDKKDYGDHLKYFYDYNIYTWKKQYIATIKDNTESDQYSKSASIVSIITPTYNTPYKILLECINSLRYQSFQFWELILVDDASANTDTLQCLKDISRLNDKRIKIYYNKNNKGICKTTNEAVKHAGSEYIAFLDHDDRLTPDALYYVYKSLKYDPDLIYSDRDMLSPDGNRTIHTFKPSWSPELLLSGNYLFHLVVVRKEIFQKLGGYRKKFEGSQDLDFLLRFAEYSDNVYHIPRVLYNWRQADTSVALNPDLKDDVYKAGLRSVDDALRRRNIPGKSYEIRSLWRGNFAIKFNHKSIDNINIITFDNTRNLAGTLNETISGSPKKFLVFLHPSLEPKGKISNKELTIPLTLKNIAMATGKILTNDRLQHAGLALRNNCSLIELFRGAEISDPGYMAFTSVMRNVSTAHPYCFSVNKKVWEDCNGFDEAYRGFHAVYDFCLRALQKSYRIIYNPFALYNTNMEFDISGYSDDFIRFKNKWKPFKDPYHNPNFRQNSNNMTLK